TASRIVGTSAADSSVSASDSNLNWSVKCRGAGGSAARASPNSRVTSSALMVVTGPGAVPGVVLSDPRALDTSIDPNSLCTTMRPSTWVSGSGSSTITAGAGGAAGVAGETRLPPQPASRRAISPSWSLRLTPQAPDLVPPN